MADNKKLQIMIKVRSFNYKLISKRYIVGWEWESPAEVNISISIQHLLRRAGVCMNT